MLWLEADTLIRSTRHGAKSLDDFCRLFYGLPSTGPKVIPYDFDDVVKALNTVMPYDWRRFRTLRLNRVQPNAPLEGLEAGGTEPRTFRLLIQKDDFFDTVELHYADHARYPRLERVAATPDLLTAIDSPRTQ